MVIPFLEFVMEELEVGFLVFMFLIQEKRNFAYMSQRDHYFQQIVHKHVPALSASGVLPPVSSTVAA